MIVFEFENDDHVTRKELELTTFRGTSYVWHVYSSTEKGLIDQLAELFRVVEDSSLMARARSEKTKGTFELSILWRTDLDEIGQDLVTCTEKFIRAIDRESAEAKKILEEQKKNERSKNLRIC